jgi:raffinose/stachyose/melibiose transport system permease protein
LRWLSQTRYKVMLLLPCLVLYIAYIIAPIFLSFYYSFMRYSGIGKPRWIGLTNYRLLFSNPIFLNSIKNSFVIMVVSLALLVPLSFFCALLLNQKFPGTSVAQTLVFSPAIMAPIIVGLIWSYIFEPSYGLLNSLLSAVGLEHWTRQWIGGPTLTPYAVAIVYVWQQLGFYAAIFIAGLRSVPGELYESAHIDGASLWQQTAYITVPMIKYVFTVVIIHVINGTLKIFEIVLQLTNGGPNHLSETMVTYGYSMTFTNGRYGYGMAMTVINFVICIGFSIAYLALVREKQQA